jgi:hypothetical protein
MDMRIAQNNNSNNNNNNNNNNIGHAVKECLFSFIFPSVTLRGPLCCCDRYVSVTAIILTITKGRNLLKFGYF